MSRSLSCRSLKTIITVAEICCLMGAQFVIDEAHFTVLT